MDSGEDSAGPLRIGVIVTQDVRARSELVALVARNSDLELAAVMSRPVPLPLAGTVHSVRRAAFAGLVATEHRALRDRQTPHFPIPPELLIDMRDPGALALRELDIVVADDGHGIPDDVRDSCRLGGVWVTFGTAGLPSHPPVGFSEALTRTTGTGFTVWHCDSAGARELLSSASTTDAYFTRNAAKVRARAARSVVARLLSLPTSTPDSSTTDVRFAMTPVEDPPPLGEQLRYVSSVGVRLANAAMRRLNLFDDRAEWHVAYSKTHWRTLARERATTIQNPPGGALADPFIAARDGQVVCFVEQIERETGLGSIAAYRIDGPRPERLGTVIYETFHMSFPFVFEFAGELYMCPETGSARDIRLYRCVEFPVRWEFCRSLMTEIVAVDTIVFESAGRWWLLTSTDRLDTGEFTDSLELFSADSPLSDTWIPHPLNPVVRDITRVRNGGVIIEGDRVLRVAQNPGPAGYGYDVTVREIVEIGPQDYDEVEIARLGPDFRPGLDGTHHLHSTGAWTVFDYRTRERRWSGRNQK